MIRSIEINYLYHRRFIIIKTLTCKLTYQFRAYQYNLYFSVNLVTVCVTYNAIKIAFKWNSCKTHRT